MTAGLGDGRFGPIYIGVDPESDRVVVIRTFAQSMTDEQQRKLVTALQRLCDSPLEHPAIAEPLACGVEAGLVYLAHDYLPGSSVDEFLQTHGPRPLAEVARRVKRLAGAIDAAAEAGIYHGALGPRDIIFGPDNTGVSGFGLARAVSEAGIEGGIPSLADDLYAMGAMTFEMLLGYRYNGGDLHDALSELASDGVEMETLVGALSSALNPDPGDWPPTAMQFATALQSAVIPAQTSKRGAAGATGAKPENVGRLAFEPLDAAVPPVAAPDDTVPVERARQQPPSRPVTFPDDVERPELPLFDLSLHEAPDLPALSHVPEPVSMREFPPAPSFGAPHFGAAQAEAARDSSRSRGALIAAIVVLLAVVGAVAFYVSSGGLGGGTESGAGSEITDGSAPADPTAASGSPDASGAAGGAQAGDQGVINLDGPQAGGNGARTPPAPSASSGAPPARAESTPPPVIPDAPAEPTRRTPEPAARPSDNAPRASDSAPRASDTAPRAPRPAPPAGEQARRPAEPTRPVTPPPAVPPETESAAQGRVLVRSTPSGARVIVNGEYKGETPVAIRGLELGAHTIVVTSPGRPAWEQRIVLTPERPSQSFEISLDGGASAAPAVPASPATGPVAPNVAASMHVDSRPAGAQVWMDGSLVGTTPFALPRVGSGLHMVRIELDGFRPWTTSVTVGQGERVRVAASLER